MFRDRLRHQQSNAQAHEMPNLNTSNEGSAEGTSAFLSEVISVQDNIQRMNANVSQIATLHARMMNTIDQKGSHDAVQLEQITADTRVLSNDLKERIKALEHLILGPDAQLRKNQIIVVRLRFLDALRNYQSVEQEYRVKLRQRIERQVKIVKPDATSEDIKAAVDGGQDIFTEALTSSFRYEESRAAFREAQERQQDIKKMERTLVELAQLFTDMGDLVEQQQEPVEHTEMKASQIEVDTEKAVQHTWKAVLSGRSYRKGRLICFGIFISLLCILAIALGVGITRK